MEIVDFKPVLDQNSSILAKFSLWFPKMGMTYHNFKLMRSKKGHRFVSPPSYKEGEDEFGKPIFKPLITFTEEKKQSFQEAVLKLLEAEIIPPRL